MDVRVGLWRRLSAEELWCWRRLLRVPWTARRSNQSILKEISPRIPLEGMMLKLKLQYFGHFMRRVDSLEKTLMLGGIGGRRRRGTTEDEMAGWHHWLDERESEWTPGDGDEQGGLVCCDSWGLKESDTTEWLNWTILFWLWSFCNKIWSHFQHTFIVYVVTWENNTKVGDLSFHSWSSQSLGHGKVKRILQPSIRRTTKEAGSENKRLWLSTTWTPN